jgi:type I restriction enzyme S subunit
MSDWPQKTLGDLITLQRGIDLPEAERGAGAVPIMGSFGITGRHSKAACKGPGVTVGRSGASAGTICYIEEDFWPLNTCLYVRDFKGNDPRFVYYFLKTFDLARLNSGSAQPSLNRNFVYPVPAAFPEPPGQIAIASILGALDDKIELNRQMNKTLEAMARAVFKDWFVDFGPTRAKMEGSTPYLAPKIWPLFPDRLDDEGKPQGWLEKPLSDFFEIVGGGTPKTSIESYWNGDIPWFSVVDTPPSGNLFVFDTEKAITKLGLAESAACLVPAGTTIISARGTVGNLAIAAQDMTFNQSCYALCSKGAVGDIFVFLAAQNMVARLQAMAHGSVFSTITRSTFEAITSPMPTEALLEEFEEAAKPLLAKIKANVNESRTLAATRDLLLPKLMSGEIRVREADKFAERAVP